MIALMPRAALRDPDGVSYPAPHPGGPVGGGYSAPGAAHRSAHSPAECAQARHAPGDCVRVLVVDLDQPDAVRRALDHLTGLACSPT